MGHWSATHRKIAIFSWLAFVFAAIALGLQVPQKTIDQQSSNAGQARRADQILAQAGFAQSGRLTEIVIVHSGTVRIAAPSFRAVVADVVHTLAPFSAVHNLRSPLGSRPHGTGGIRGVFALGARR
jgi:RND superfamily putative drug exporter